MITLSFETQFGSFTTIKDTEHQNTLSIEKYGKGR